MILYGIRLIVQVKKKWQMIISYRVVLDKSVKWLSDFKDTLNKILSDNVNLEIFLNLKNQGILINWTTLRITSIVSVLYRNSKILFMFSYFVGGD